MDSSVREALDRAQAQRRRISDLEDQLESERAALGADLQRLIDSSGLSGRALAELLGYRSATSIRRAVRRGQAAAETGKATSGAEREPDRSSAQKAAGSAGTTA